MDNERKTIKVSPKTHEELKKIGHKGETFDELIYRLIEKHKEEEQSDNDK